MTLLDNCDNETRSQDQAKASGCMPQKDYRKPSCNLVQKDGSTDCACVVQKCRARDCAWVFCPLSRQPSLNQNSGDLEVTHKILVLGE